MVTSEVFAVENIYGHTKRLRWILDHIKRGDTILELGCGTGYMITLPLARMKYSVIGVDLDHRSIAYGHKLFLQEDLDPNSLKAADLSEINISPDVIIASELLEHIRNEDMVRTLNMIWNKLKPFGKFLVTVPNGYGGFEIEKFLWLKTGKGRLLERLGIDRLVRIVKLKAFGCDTQERQPPSTLSDSPHVQRFTYASIQDLLCSHGFEVTQVKGSVLFAGPFSNLLFTGIEPIMWLNCALGGMFPRVAAGVYVACKKLG